MNKTGRNILIVFLALFLLAGTFSGGLILGWLLPQKGTLDAALQTNVLATPDPTETASSDTTALFEPFWQAWQLVHDEYVDQPVDDTKLMEGAIRGMMDSLGDKHTSYMSPDEYKQATMPLDGSYEGIGAYVDASGDYLTIITPMAGSPAETAGLKSGDEITAIDGNDMSGIDPNIVLQSVLGPAGSSVVLTIHRPDPDSTFDVTIKRAKIVVPTIESKMLDNQIGYIALATFGDTTTEDLKKAITELMAQNPKGLILDLRNNGGGYLNTAIEVVSQFVGDGVVMYEEEASGTMNEYNAIPGGLATKIPLVVLVNAGTASASEITAGAIQDYGRGVLVGTTTYGKGSVQNWITLDNDQGAVRITVAHWLTPKQRQINGVGLTPDYVVELTEEDITNKNDAQLKKAIEILLNNQ
ncbi:MAG: S41 family peptidase [Anaerolineaceae bacterium]|nr:S41 family peptidase [Anaerolineaceae bacterium]